MVVDLGYGWRELGRLAVAGMLVLTVGCATSVPRELPLHRSNKAPGFMVTDTNYVEYIPLSGGYKSSMRTTDTASVFISSPEGSAIVFESGRRHAIVGKDTEVLKLQPGLYPIQLEHAAKKTLLLSGLLLVRNVTKEVGLATLGKNDDTRMFNPELLKQASQGQLVSHTISFDGTDVVTYWLGNREKPCGSPSGTCEVDFSRISGIESLVVNGKDAPTFRAVVAVARGTVWDARTRRMVPSLHEHAITLAVKGRKYRGYIRNLKATEFTAFVRVPCTIPDVLLDAADRGTVSKFTVRSSGAAEVDVAEIVLSGHE